jgi:hypothetical protein
MSHWSDEQTDDPRYADQRDFCKLEKWTKDGTKVDRLLYAGNNLEKARRLIADAIKHRPRQAYDPPANADHCRVAE